MKELNDLNEKKTWEVIKNPEILFKTNVLSGKVCDSYEEKMI